MHAMGSYKIKRFPDNCYAVVRGSRRGPVGPDRRRAIGRFIGSGLIASASTDKDGRAPRGVKLEKRAHRAKAI